MTPAPVATAALPLPLDSTNPKELYETAYGYLLQRDYGAAQAAFDDFLAKYPNNSLSGNAQYWLGETHFVRGQYKAAAGAFLKGYQTYAQSAKAPDSLLKLAMSLDRLGQKDAACSSYAELSSKFPNAPQSVIGALAALGRARGFIRYQLGIVLRMKHTPELHFVYDDADVRASRIEELLSKELAEAREREKERRVE